MSISLLELMRDRLHDGLNRRAVSSASQWATLYRRTPQEGKWNFDRCPWTREMHDTKAEHNVGQKGAQLCYTETLLSVGFYNNDILSRDVLYVLPNQNPDASNFSSARFDAAVLASPHLSKLYDRSNVGHKRSGTANFYIRGGQSRAGLKSVPVSVLILDELDEMNEDAVPLAEERTSGQFDKLIWAISTPTATGHGINKLYQESSQEHYHFKCPACSRYIELTFPESLEVVGDDPDGELVHQSYLKCSLCQNKLLHEDKSLLFRDARWVPSVLGKEKRGFHINQLYSMTVTPGAVAAAWLRAQVSAAAEQEFWNSKMGLPHETAGSSIGHSQVDAVKRDYLNGSRARQGYLVTMGVDVGKFNHYEVCEWTLGPGIANDVNSESTPRVIDCGKVRDFDQLDTLMIEHGVHSCVIDAQPERRAAFQFSQRFWGSVKMCFYGNGVAGKAIHEEKSDLGEPKITVDRTSWMDQALGRFQSQKIGLPRDLPYEYEEHLTACARIWKKDAVGNPVGTWIQKTGKADHHAHARTYAEIALALAGHQQQATDIVSPMDESEEVVDY